MTLEKQIQDRITELDEYIAAYESRVKYTSLHEDRQYFLGKAHAYKYIRNKLSLDVSFYEKESQP